MALPWDSFTTSASRIDTFIASKLSSTVVGVLYNLAYRTILTSYQWSARKAELVLNTVDPYSTGTVSITQGDTAITGSSTVWTSSHTGMFIRIESDDVFYEFTRTAATTGTIEKAYAGDTVTDGDYELFQYKYSIDATDGEVGELLLPYEGMPIHERSLYWLTLRDPARRQTGSTALHYVMHGVDSDGSQMIEFWPRYSEATAIRIPYLKRIDDISGSTKPIIRSDLVEALALQYCYTRLATEFGDPQYDRQREYWSTVYNELYGAAVREDMNKQGLPDAIQDSWAVRGDHDFIATHDVRIW